MKFKKCVALFVVSVCMCLAGISQEYKTEQPAASDAFLVPRTAKIRINPYSDNYSINHVLIQEAYFNRRVSPKNGIDFSKVSYTIMPKSTETIVFYGEYDAMTESKYELFITEENAYKIKIPEFSWSGTSLPKDSDDDDAKHYIREDGKLIDGEYILKIDLLRYSDDTEKETESLGNIQEYTIEIDTTPPLIDYKILFVCDDSLENGYSRYIVPINHGKSEYEYMANGWRIIGNCGSDTFAYDLPVSLPVFCVERFSDNNCLKIIAEDALGNRAEKEILVESRDFASDEPEEAQVIETSMFEYLNAVQESLSPFCEDFKLDLAASDCAEFQIQEDKKEIIATNFEKYPLYIVFSANNHSETKIPVKCSDDALSFQLDDTILPKDIYHIFLSDGNDVSFFLGRKFIYNSDAKLRIKTLVGFDGRNYLSVPDILFPASSPSFLENDEFAHENLRIIKATVEIINDNIEDIAYVEILGYANPERSGHGDTVLMQENEDSLLPLSQKRADYVKQIMELMGISGDLLVTVPCGGVPYETNPGDKENSYKNRRVRLNVVQK